eukprot:ANDGO_05589.mRNA.1 Protein CbbY
MKIRGLLLDVDGLLVDSEPHSCRSWNDVFELFYDVDVGDDYSQIYGTSAKETLRFYSEAHGLDFGSMDIAKLEKAKDEFYIKRASGKLKAFDGALHIIEKVGHVFANPTEQPEADGNVDKMWIAVASSGSPEKIAFNLAQSGLLSALQQLNAPLVSAKSMRGKPHPDVFVAAAKAIGLSPSECLVLEDAKTGIEAARSAGCRVVAVASTFSADSLNDHGKADCVVPSLRYLADHWNEVVAEVSAKTA